MLSGARFMHDIYEAAVLKDSRIAADLKRARVRQWRIVMWLVKAVTVAVILAIIFASYGCVTTIRGVGQGISGIGQGVGTIVVGAGDYLQEEMEGK